MRTIAIANHKGGVGKSAVTVCLAGALAEVGKRVLVVDLDQQGTSTEWLGARHPGELAQTDLYGARLRDALADGLPLDPLVLQTRTGVDLIGCGTGFAAFERAVSGQLAAEGLLARALAQLPRSWDFILLDCPPSLGLATMNALVAAERMLIPVEPKSASRTPILTLLRVARDVSELLNRDLELLGIVVSRLQHRIQHRQVQSWLRSSFGDRVLQSALRESTHIGESHAFQKPVTAYMPICNGSDDFRVLRDEFLSRLEDSTSSHDGVLAHG
jgi:chromosome partitioning protein